MKPSILTRSIAALVAIPLLAGIPQRAEATDVVWGTNLGAGPWVWNTAGNWTGGVAPVVATDRGDLRKDWTAAAAVNFGAATTINGILFDDTGAAGDVGVTIGNGGTAANTLTLAGTAPVVQVDGSTLTISTVMAGTVAWSKTGAGTLVLSGANTYTGATTISAGTVIAQANAAFGTNAAGTTISSGATLNLGGTLAGGALNLGTEAISVGGTGVGGLGAIIATGTADQQNAIQGAVTMTSDTTFGGTRRWDIRNAALNGGGFTVTKVGGNSVFLSGNATANNLNQIVVRQGEFVVETGAQVDTTNVANGIIVEPTTGVQAAFRSWGNNVDHSANITLNSTFAGSSTRLEVQNGTTSHSGDIITVGGDNRLDVDVNQVMILNGVLSGAASTVRKEDAGTLLINNAANTHDGTFTINGGIVGGMGTLASATVNLNNGATLSPGFGVLNAGTFSVTNTLVSSGTNAGVFNLGTSSDLINVGTLTQNGTTNISVITGPGIAAGTYTLFDYGTLDGTNGLAGFKLGGNHVDGTIQNNSGAGTIELVLNSANPLAWSGNSNGILQTGSLTNPVLPNFNWPAAPGGKAEFVNTDNLLFDDTATGTTNVIISGTVTPGSLRFNNSTLDYTIDGTFTGPTGFVKDGAGKVTLLSDQTFQGPVSVNAGTLQMGSDSRQMRLQGTNSNNLADVSPAITIAPGATLAISAGGNAELSVNNPMSGSGSIVLNSSQQDTFYNYNADRGNVAFRANNSGFTGSITINDGNRLRANTQFALGNASGITIANGGALLIDPAAPLTYSGPISVAGRGWQETTGEVGALRINNGTLTGPITMTGDSRFTAYTNSGGTISGVISGAFDLELGLNQIGANGSGTLTISNPANTYSGDTTLSRILVNAATLADSGVNSSLGSGSTLLFENSTLQLTGAGAMTSNRAIVIGSLGIGGGSIGLSDSGATLTLTGAITSPIAAGTQFGGQINFQQTLVAGTGGTVILDTATPILSTGTTVHRQNLTLAGNTNFTVGASGVNAGGAFNVGNSVTGNAGNVTLTIQDNAVLSVYGEFDIGNQGAAQTYTVNQSGTTVVNALRGSGTTSTDHDILHRAMRIGHWGSETTIYNLNGGTLNAPNGHLWVGYDGSGTLNQAAGTTVNAAGLRMVRTSTTPANYNLNGGVLNVGAYGFAKGGTGTAVPQFNFNGGTYRATADHAISSNIAINFLAGNGTFDTNGFNVSSGSALLVGAGGSFTKIGAGEFALPTNNSISGGINVDGGALSSIVANAAITASTVTVNNGGTLAGGFNVTSAGGVVVNSGGTISPGTKSGADGGTITTSSLTLNAGSQVNLTPTGDLITVTTASTGLSGNTNINVLPVGVLAAGPINLINYTTANTLTFTSSLPHLIAASVTDNGAGSIQLNHGGQETLTWTGGTNGIWDTTPANVNFNASTSGAVSFLQGDVTVFDDSTLPTNPAITVAAGGVSTASLVINDAAGVFSFSGGAIGGGTSLVKNGVGTTVLANNNTYVGTTTISAGTLQIGNGGTSGRLGVGATTNDGTLSFNRSDASTYNGIISGAGVVRSDGSGVTTLNGVNTYAGGTVISKGTLQGNHNSFGAVTITLNDGATGANDTALLIQNGTGTGTTVTNNIVVSNNGTGSSTIGSSEDSQIGSGLFFSGTLTLDRPTTLLGEFDRTTFTNVISGNVGTLTIGRSTGLEDQEMGRVLLEKNNTFVGNVVVLDNTFLQLTDISNVPANTVKDQIPDTASVTLGHNSYLQIGNSGSAFDGEVIGDLISSQSTSRIRSLANVAGNFTFGTANDTTFNGVLDGGNTLTHVKQGSGTVTLGGTFDNPATRLVVNGGTVILAKDSANTVHALGTSLVINSGATVRLGGTFLENRTEDLGRNNNGGMPLNAPANYVDQIWGDADVTVSAGGTFDLNGKSETIDGLIGAGTVTNNGAVASNLYIGSNGAAGTFTGVIQDGASVLNLVKNGNGIETLGGTNLYTGTTEIRGGQITMTNVAALGTDTAGTVMGPSRDGTVTLVVAVTTPSDPSAPNIISEPFTFISETSNDQRTNLQNNNESTRLTGDIVLQGDGIMQINANQAAGDQFQINSSITGSSNGILFLRGNTEMQINGVINAPNVTLAKTEPSLLILNSTGNNYFETTLVHGTVRTDVDNALDTGAVLRMGQNGNANTLELNGTNQTVAGIRINIGTTDTNARTITNSSATASVFTINTPTATGGDYAYAGLIAGNLQLVKSGPGKQVLSTPLTGVNSFTGGTSITGGTLAIYSDAALGLVTGGIEMSNDATLQATGAVTTTARTLTLGAGGGTIDTNGNTVTFGAGSTIDGTTLTKIGEGKLSIEATQTYSTLNTEDGRTDLLSALGTGTSTINADADINIAVSQTLAALNIGADAVVTLGSPVPPAPAFLVGDDLFADAGGLGGAAASADGGVQAVPEPGSVSLLLLGALGLLGRRRSKKN